MSAQEKAAKVLVTPEAAGQRQHHAASECLSSPSIVHQRPMPVNNALLDWLRELWAEAMEAGDLEWAYRLARLGRWVKARSNPAPALQRLLPAMPDRATWLAWASVHLRRAA